MARLFKAEAWNPAWSVLPPWAQVKEDGHRLIVVRGVGAHRHCVMALTTSFIDISPKLSSYQWFSTVSRAMLSGEQMDAELCVEGGTSEDVKTAIKLRDPALQFKPFAWTHYEDEAQIDVVTEALKYYDLNPPGFVSTRLHCVESLMGYAEVKKWEGWILKDGNYKGWYKLKRERTIDLIIDAVKPGKNKYTNMIGSFVLRTTCGRVVGHAAGMPDEVRAMAYFECVGRVIEVKYQRVGNNGKLVLPRMLRFRDDKSPLDCPLSQDPLLEAHYVS